MIPDEAIPPYDPELVKRLVGRTCETELPGKYRAFGRIVFVSMTGCDDRYEAHVHFEVINCLQYQYYAGRTFAMDLSRMLWPEKIPEDTLLVALMRENRGIK